MVPDLSPTPTILVRVRLCVRSKGSPLTTRTSRRSTGVIDSMIQGTTGSVSIHKKGAITRDPKTKNIVNKDQTKTFSLGYYKRVIQDNYDTLPYGY